MSSKRWSSALLAPAALVAALAVAGCAGKAEPAADVSAEPMKVRLANQARAIAELSTENEKLLARIENLTREIARLEAELKRLQPAPAPAPAPAPTKAPEAAPPPVGRY